MEALELQALGEEDESDVLLRTLQMGELRGSRQGTDQFTGGLQKYSKIQEKALCNVCHSLFAPR